MPFSGTARWEVLVGLRNLFRDPNDAGSIYDELLVVRPPKRVIGGVLDSLLSISIQLDTAHPDAIGIVRIPAARARDINS